MAFCLALIGQITLKGPLKNFSWIFYCIAVIVFVYIFRSLSLSRILLQKKDAENQPPNHGIIRTSLLAFSLITAFLSFKLFDATYNPLAWVVHFLSIFLFIASFIQPPNLKIRNHSSSLVLLSGILLLASLVRFWQLDQIPFGTWYDESFNGNIASNILQDPSFRPVFLETDTLPSYLAYLFALSFSMFGMTTAAMRYVTAAFGVITVVLAYLLFRRWFNERVGLIAAFLLAIMRYDLTFSRIAMHGITTPAFELLSLYLLDRALERKQFADFAWLGLVLGFGLAFYTPFRLFPLIILSFLLLVAFINIWRQRIIKKDMQGSAWNWPRLPGWELRFSISILVMLIGMIIAVSPLIQFTLKNPDVVTDRLSVITIFQHRDEPDLAKALWSNTVKHLLMFNVQGDRNGRHNLPGEPMLDNVTGALFVLGIGYGLWRWRDPANLLMLLIFFLMLLAGILTVDFEAPQSLRSIGVIPALVYFSVLPMEWLIVNFRSAFQPFDGKRGFSIQNSTIQAGLPEVRRLASLGLGLAGLLASIAYLNINTYFTKQETLPGVWAEHSAAETIVANEMNRLALSYDFVISALYDNHPTVRFLAGNIKNYQRWSAVDRLPLVGEDKNRGVVMFFDEKLLSAYREAQRFYPDAEFIEHHAPAGGGTVLYEVIVAPEDLQAINGVVAQYFEADNTEGQPVREETLSQAAIDWTLTQPLQDTFVASLRSTLYATEYGQYRFVVHGPSGSRLWIDEFPVNGELVTLARGNHALRLYMPGVKSKIELWWQQPGAIEEEPVPGSNLFRPPVTNNGLLGAYYPSPDWSGNPAFTQIDPEIAFYFHIIPLPRPYTVEWKGKLFAPSTGDYHFALSSVDSSQLRLDDSLVVDNLNGHTTIEGNITLTQGWHDIDVRFADRTGGTQIYLYWTPPGNSQNVLIPASNLLPPMGQYPSKPDVLNAADP